ncbi:efflux RND transporter periplasmic adaptor subunit [Chitinophaga silvisoli]|uniref:HlyD family efflux transporter periplasmic adaptor subunit n=1 Tax=Chitinophaga silvisoli TaxID=2291814 RepID=A0A3E1P9S1_9BACT|nr:HlyD family efflux transporter periplasmic adaptor subunit [Chitinophaga silvisoli]RFM36929.1 HlyD family efflux transporter periplasmic adaptor subunit [Chitinophaga silvisoli]
MNIQQTIGILSACLIFSACGQKTAPVKPERKDLTEMVFASGVLEADDQNNLTAQTDGYLIKLDFKEGDQVNAGQLLAVIDNSQNIINAQSAGTLHNIARENTLPSAPALQQISANITAAKEKLRLDQLQADRYKRLMESNSVSKLEYENTQLTLATSQANLKALEDQYNTQLVAARQQEVTQRSMSEVNRVIKEQNQIKAVISGQIYEKKKQLGDYVRKGDVIAVIANPQLIYARLNVDETNMARVKVGEEAVIQLNTNKEHTYKGTVHEILPSFESASQSFIVKAYFTDSLDFRIIGTQLEANIIVGEKKNALVIPRSFLSYGNKVTIKGKGPVVIQTGIISNDWVEVKGGLTENDELVPEKK